MQRQSADSVGKFGGLLAVAAENDGVALHQSPGQNDLITWEFVS